jgi:hypothetical protein
MVPFEAIYIKSVSGNDLLMLSIQLDNIGSFNIPITAFCAIKAPAIILIQKKVDASLTINGRKSIEIMRLQKIPSVTASVCCDIPEMITTLSKHIRKSVAAIINRTLTFKNLVLLAGLVKSSPLIDLLTSLER